MQLFLNTAISLTMFFSATPEKPVKQKWVSLFDGTTTRGWNSYGKAYAGEAWKVVDGALYLDSKSKKTQNTSGGDIISETTYENFHLKLEWKISAKGNSGIFFWVQNDPINQSSVWLTGPEMQVLDNDGHYDGTINKHRAGNLYDLIAGTEGAVKPVGEWNKAEIIVNKGNLKFILNGITTVNTTYGNQQWDSLIAGSKFKDMPAFAKKFKGHIALQDHGDDVWFRNIMIKEL